MPKGVITQKNKEEFRKSYEDAQKNGIEQFIFEGKEILTAYAKYLLQYLDSLSA